MNDIEHYSKTQNNIDIWTNVLDKDINFDNEYKQDVLHESNSCISSDNGRKPYLYQRSFNTTSVYNDIIELSIESYN